MYFVLGMPNVWFYCFLHLAQFCAPLKWRPGQVVPFAPGYATACLISMACGRSSIWDWLLYWFGITSSEVIFAARVYENHLWNDMFHTFSLNFLQTTITFWDFLWSVDSVNLWWCCHESHLTLSDASCQAPYGVKSYRLNKCITTWTYFLTLNKTCRLPYR